MHPRPLLLWLGKAILLVLILIVLLIALTFFAFGLEGFATSNGLIGSSGELVITHCTGSGRSYQCEGTLVGGDPSAPLQYQGASPPGSQVAVRFWSGDPSAAWPADGSSWYMWLAPLLGGAIGAVVLTSALVRWIRLIRGRPLTGKLA